MRYLRSALPLIVALMFSGCIATITRVEACLTPGQSRGSAPSRGGLVVLASPVSGVTIDSATWWTEVGSEDIGFWEKVIYQTALRSDRAVGVDELALIYQSPGATPIVDAGLPELSPGIPRWPSRSVRLRSGFWITSPSGLRHCPQSVRLVRRRDLALYLQPRATASVAGDSLVLRAGDARPLVVVSDTVLSIAFGESLVIGAMFNASDTTLRDMVAALVIQKTATRYAPHPDTTARDTLEYRVDSIPARTLLGFAGGFLNYDERVVLRASYPAVAITGREIAGAGNRHRSSWAANDAARRAVRRPR